MIYYMIRHIATKEFMPELERGRGYSHWNPAVEPTEKRFRPRKLTGCPRLFPSRASAVRSVNAWFNYPNAYVTMRRSSSHLGDDDDLDYDVKEDGRKKEDLEVVEVVILDRMEFTKGFHQMVEDINNEQS